MKPIPCDIAIMPPDEVSRRAIATSEQLHKHGTLFTLRDGAVYPHVSLYMIQLKHTDLEKAKALLAAIASRLRPLELTAAKYNQAEGYIDVEYTRSDEIGQLQKDTVTALNPIRVGLSEMDKIRILTATGKAKENLEAYGYRYVGEMFRPHMTFTRFKGGNSVDTEPLPALSVFNGRSMRLCLFELGDNGTCIREIAGIALPIPAP